jgi:magnesium transporter
MYLDSPAIAITQSAAPGTPGSFCVALRADGQVEKAQDKTPEEYISLIGGTDTAWIDYAVKDMDKELEKLALSMGFTQIPVQKLLSGFFSGYEDTDTELGIMLPAVKVEHFDMVIRQLVILIRGNFILTVHNDDVVRLLRFSRYAPTFMKKIKADLTVDKLTLILERIIDENNDRNFEYLREIEKHGDDISKQLISEDVGKKELAQNIYGMKHVLIDYLNVLWATKDVIDSLQYGDADLITDDEKLLGRIGILSGNIDRHIELSEQMSNVLSSGLEVMQSIYNNQLQSINNRFSLVTAYLTVLGTAALVPNTLATIAGSGIFTNIHSQPDWYPPLLVISTIVATAVSLLWVIRVWHKKDDSQAFNPAIK